VVGVAPYCSYLPIALKAIGRGTSPPYTASFSISAILNGYSALGAVKRLPGYSPVYLYGQGVYVPYYNVEVANMSWGFRSSGNRVGNRHLSYIGRYVLFIASACHASVMAVAGYERDGNRRPSSNYQAYVEIAAPGAEIWTSDMTGYTQNALYHKGYSKPTDPWGENAWKFGTSFAAPCVSGVAALVVAEDPWLSPWGIRGRIRDTHADLPGDLAFCGRVDAAAAVE
jgi:subtilisin family serine protease